MNDRTIYIAAGALGLLGLGAFGIASLREERSPELAALLKEGAREEPKELASVARGKTSRDKVQRRRSAVQETEAPGAEAEAGAEPPEESLFVATDVVDVDDSAWIQSMYDRAYVYQGPVLSKAEQEQREKDRLGIHTEDGMRAKEDALVKAMPEMRAEIEEARKTREAEQARFEQVGVSPEEKAARDGVQLEQ